MVGIAPALALAARDKAPVARLAVTQVAVPPLTVSASAAGSADRDATPIASYRLDFGDGTSPVTITAPNTTAAHTYSLAGTYTVRLTATDTGGLTSTAVSANITVRADNPPTANLSVKQVATPPLTVTADASASTDGDLTPIASYQFDFGDGSPPVVKTAPTATASHAYAAAGVYSVTVTLTDTGSNTSAPASASISVRPELAPTAQVSVTQAASPALTVTADGSASADTDLTPIASYWFDFGDGSAAVTTTAPTATAQHTYATAGTYAVTLTATDTGNNTSAPASASIVVAPPPENPPVAKLAVTQLPSPALTVSADAAGSTDGDLTPIASYRFTFGDGTPATVVNAPTTTAQYTYAAAGTYTVTLIATDTANNASAPVTASVLVQASTGAQIAVYAGYYDTHHSGYPKPKPDPWQGSPNVLFVGTPDSPSGGWDSSTLRIDNLGATSLSGVGVTVDMGSRHFALWSATTIPAGSRLILAQTAFENFDGSDTSPAGCYSCDPNDCLTKMSSAIPVVHLTIGGTTTNYYDSGQVLNTHGVDAAGCPYTGTRNDESTNWQAIYPQFPATYQVAGGDTAQLGVQLPAASHVWLSSPRPNPSRGELAIRFGTTARGPVRLGIYDVAGRLVKVSVDGVFEPGDYDDQVNMGGVGAGLYYYRLTTPEGTLSRAFVVVR